jgi:hypothetical protein
MDFIPVKRGILSCNAVGYIWQIWWLGAWEGWTKQTFWVDTAITCCAGWSLRPEVVKNCLYRWIPHVRVVEPSEFGIMGFWSHNVVKARSGKGYWQCGRNQR